MNGNALVFDHVGIRYTTQQGAVLSEASFSVAPGERVALVGLNGSGKTTLLLSAAGLVPHEGRIVVCGVPVAPRTISAARDRIGFLFNVPEDQVLFPTVLEDVAFSLVRKGQALHDASSRARETLGTLGIGHLCESPIHQLSHGQKQRVALAGALVGSPGLLLLDEPTSGLDPCGKEALLSLLLQGQAAILVATHDLDFASRLCTRFLLLEDRTLALDGRDFGAVRTRWGLR